MDNIQFTKDFDLVKLTHSDTATRNHIIEQFQPSASIIENLKALAVNILQPLREALGADFFISCAFRCPAVNKAVGGAETSQHMTGQASDNIYPKGNLYLAKTVLTHDLPFDQMILEGGTLVKPNWIHLSYSPRNRREILRADFSSGKAVYTPLTKQQVLSL